MSLPVPVTAADLTPGWLRAALAAHFPGSRVDAVSIERVGEGFGLASVLLRCRIEGSGCPRSVVVKLWPLGLHAGTSEVRFHQVAAPRLGIRVPACHHGAIDEANARGVLVLEDLGAAVQGDCLELLDRGGAVQMAEILATYHAAWWEREALHEADWLEPVRVRTPEWLSERREQFLRRFAGRAEPSLLALLDQVHAVQARGDERLAGAPATLLHADLHMDNVLFVGDRASPVLLDWARAARGPAAIDVAELLFQMAPLAELDHVLPAYLRALERHGVEGLAERDFRRQLGGALLRMVVRCTCGIAAWRPERAREERIIDTTLARVARAVEHWRGVDAELFGR